MAEPEQFNADQLAFWNGPGGHIWVERQEHTDITLAPVTEALLAFAAPHTGERVLDVGCGCGATTLEFARAVGPAGRVAALDISGPMLAEGQARAKAAGITNVAWQQADPAMAALDEYDLLTSAFGVMFFGDPWSLCQHAQRRQPWRADGVRVLATAAENPWMEVPMNAVSRHLPPRPKPNPQAPGMFAFADPERISEILTAAGWAAPRLEKLDLDLDIAVGRGLEEAVDQSTKIRRRQQLAAQPAGGIVTAAIASVREALAAHLDGASVAFLVRCGWSAARLSECAPSLTDFVACVRFWPIAYICLRCRCRKPALNRALSPARLGPSKAKSRKFLKDISSAPPPSLQQAGPRQP